MTVKEQRPSSSSSSSYIPSKLRLCVTLFFVVPGIMSPMLMLVNPSMVVHGAAVVVPSAGETNNSNSIDTSGYHSNLPILEMPTATVTTPSSISSTPTIQAALQNVLSFQSNDIVNSQAIYEVLFRTATTGTIKTIEMTFPAGTGIGLAGYIERTGIGAPASFTKAGNTIIYTVATPASVPAGTPIRFELVNIQNPPNPSSSYHVTITTRNPANTIIDGPTASVAYNIKQIGSNDLDETLIFSRLLNDNAQGASFGWNPNGVETNFIIFDESIQGSNAVLVNVGDSSANSQCESLGSLTGFFTIRCNIAPPQGSELRFTVTNIPLL